MTTHRRQSLSVALSDIETGSVDAITRIAVNRSWWTMLPNETQTTYRRRCDALGVTLVVDDRLSPHFVEMSGGLDGPPLSSEHPI